MGSGRRWRVGLGLGLGLLVGCRPGPAPPAVPPVVQEVVWTSAFAALAEATAWSEWAREDEARDCGQLDELRARADGGGPLPRFVRQFDLQATEEPALTAALWIALRSMRDDDLRVWGIAQAVKDWLPVPPDLRAALVANLQSGRIELFTPRAAAVGTLAQAWPASARAILVEAGLDADPEPLLPPARAGQPFPPPPWQHTVPLWLRHGSRP